MSRYGFLRQPRWLALGFLVLLVVPSFFLLSRWQLSRLDDRRHDNDARHGHTRSQAPVPVDSRDDARARPRRPSATPQRWRQVTATGRYDAARPGPRAQAAARGRERLLGRHSAGDGSGAVLVGQPRLDRGRGRRHAPCRTCRRRPPGEVTVVGSRPALGAGARPQPGDLPAGQVTDLDVALVAGPARRRTRATSTS